MLAEKSHRSSSMKSILSLVALGLAMAVTAPAFAKHHTQAECEKLEGMMWDEESGKCVKK
jgi:hypothetical protein